MTEYPAVAQDSIAEPNSAIEPRGDPHWPGGVSFAQALAGARAGEAEALSALYRRFLPAVYRFLLGRLRERSLAEDLTADTFVAVMSGLASARARDELGFAAWILGIARNHLSQYYRRLQRERAHEMDLERAEIQAPLAFADERDPLAALLARERWEEVVAALNRLTPEQRAVLLQRLILGRSTDEVAALLSKPANAIYGLQFRALAALARDLKTHDQHDQHDLTEPARAARNGARPQSQSHSREEDRP